MSGLSGLPVPEPVLRLSAFAGVLAAMMLAEALWPRRRRTQSRRWRWPNNLGIVVIGNLLVRFVLPATALATALVAESTHRGLMHLVSAPMWVKVVVTVLLLDLAIYAQHVAFHHVPALWRLHRMHHADLDIDTTTGIRFHPLEILLSAIIKIALVAVLGAPASGVLVFEVLLNATAMFNHANLALPARADRMLRLVTVTPDMHRVHHSIAGEETNSNFGFNLPWWDRLFGTYRAQPKAGHDGMTIGLPYFRDPGETRIDRLLTQPFRAHE